MNKLFTKVASVTLGLALALGIGVAVAKGNKAVSVHASSNATLAHTDFSTSWTTTRGAQTGTAQGFTLSSTDGMYDSGHLRHYAGGTLTLSSSVGNMTSVVFTCTANGTNSYGPGKMSGEGYVASSGKTGTWTGNAASFSLTGGQSRITSIAITYGSGGEPAVYSDVTVDEKSALTGTYKGDAYYECTSTVTGSGSYSDVVTWSITSSNVYAADKNIEGKAAIDNDGKITFLDNCTIYVWATAADGTTHNSTGFCVVASGMVDSPSSSWTKVSSPASVSVNTIYALSNDGINFGSKSVNSSQIDLTLAYSHIGYFVLESVSGGYNLRFASFDGSKSQWKADGAYINNSDSTGLSASNTASSKWTLDEQSNSVYLKNSSNNNRHLGLSNNGAIRAYASSNIGSNLPVYLYDTGNTLPVINCDTIELTGLDETTLSISDTATLGYYALGTDGEEWVGDVKYSISNESTSGVVELSATSGVSVTLTAKKAGTATISVQDKDENASADSVNITVLADPERIELPVGSYNVEIDYSSVKAGDSVPASKEYEIKAKEGSGAGRLWYKNMAIAYTNVTANYATEYTFSKNGSASSATVTTSSEVAKVTQVVISYYNGNRLTMTDAQDNEIDIASSSSNICTYALNSESFTLSSSSTTTSIYYIHITFSVIDESEEFLSLVINKGATATSFSEGDAPNHEGLTVHENYTTDGETISRYVDVTDLVVWNYSIEKIAANTTSYTVTATFGGHTSVAVTVDGFTVTALTRYSLVESQGELFDGQIVILAAIGTNNKTAKDFNASNYLNTQDAKLSEGKIASNTEMEFVVRMYGNQFALERSGSFLNYSGSSNAVYLAEKTLNYSSTECGWTFDSTGLHSEAGNRYLKYNSSSPRFACYGDNSYQVVQLYKRDSSVMTLQNKADTFMYRELHLRDINTADGSEGTACKGNSGYYVIAKAVFTSESFADAKSIVLDNADAVARLSAWATANGDVLVDNGSGSYIIMSGSSRLPSGGLNETTIGIIIAISVITTIGIGAVIVLHKKKRVR